LTPSFLESRWVGVLLALASFSIGLATFAVSLLGGYPWTGLLALVVLTWAFQVHVSRRPWKEIGASLRLRGLAEFLAGSLAGVLMFAAVLLVMGCAGSVHLRGSPHLPGIGTVLVILAYRSLVEELLFRSYGFLTLARSLGAGAALAASTLLFALAHFDNPGFSLFPILSLLLAGVFFGLIYLRFRSLWAVWGVHFAWNASQGPLFGLPISGVTSGKIGAAYLLQTRLQGPEWWTGGAFGAEGGLPTLILLSVGIWWLHQGVWGRKRERGERKSASIPEEEDV
jgi:membrane protease YdiL (CAAX protease family)